MAGKMNIMMDSCILHIVFMDKVSVVSICRLGWGQGPCVPLVSTTLTAVTGSREPTTVDPPPSRKNRLHRKLTKTLRSPQKLIRFQVLNKHFLSRWSVPGLLGRFSTSTSTGPEGMEGFTGRADLTPQGCWEPLL